MFSTKDVSTLKIHTHKTEEIIEQMVTNTGWLMEEAVDKLQRLLSEYKGIISRHDGDIGRTSQVFHHIDTGDAKPTKQVPL